MENEFAALKKEGRKCLIMWKKNVMLIVAAILLGLALGNFLAWHSGFSSEYKATATVYSYSIGTKDFAALAPVVSAYEICNQAAQILGDDDVTVSDIQSAVSTETSTTSSRIIITVHTYSPERSVKLVNAIAYIFANTVNGKKGDKSVYVIDNAEGAGIYSDASISIWLNRIGGAAIGGVFALLVLGLIGLVTRRITVTEDFTCEGELEIMGMVPKFHN